MQNFKFSFHFFEKLLTFDTFWGILGPQAILWRHRWVQISKSLRFWLQHRILHDECSLNAKFKLFIPPLFIQFLWEFTHVYIYREVIGPLGHVTSVDPSYLLNNWFSDPVSNVILNKHYIFNMLFFYYIWTIYFLVPLWRHRAYDVTSGMMQMWQHHFL